MENTPKPSFLALSPLFIFLGVYLITSIIVNDFYKVPITVALLISSLVAIAMTTHLPLSERISHFSGGASDKNILLMIWIFILAGAFAQSAKAMGAIDATLHQTLHIIPDNLLLAGIFIAACFISLSVGTSVGTIVALTPVAVGIAEKTGIELPYMVAIVIGGAFIKSVISGTVAKETTEATRAKGFAIFYGMVNIGAFSGKTIVKPLREALGNEGLITLNYFSASMTFLALIAIWFFYKSAQHSGEGKTFRQIWNALLKVCSNGRLIILILIITGFWMVQHQLYATMPKYVLRLAGEGASPSWYANVNPLVVVLCVNLVTQLMRHRTALTSMTVGMFIMPLSALCMASGNMLNPESAILPMRPVAFMMVVGIVFQGLAETFISPRFLEYFSLQAPKGEEGLYLGFSRLHSFLSSILGFGLSGYLLSKYCPDESLFATRSEWLAASSNAHYIWYYFAVIALASAIALIIYGQVVKRLDQAKA